MNLHPILVHFPVALLTVYSILELIRLKIIKYQPYWFYVKAVVLFAGTLGALAAVLTGDMAESAARAGTVPISVTNFSQVVSMHENFADLTLIIFGVLAAAYFFSWLAKINFGAFMEKISLGGLWKFLAGFGKIFADSRVSIILALLGLISVTITGGLGGIMVYGPGVDPFFGMVFKLFFK